MKQQKGLTDKELIHKYEAGSLLILERQSKKRLKNTSLLKESCPTGQRKINELLPIKFFKLDRCCGNNNS